MRRLRSLLAGFLALVLAAPATAEIYRWVDSAGRVHFGDQLPNDVSRARQLPNQPLPETPKEAKAREVAQRSPVTLYTSACGEYCDQAVALLRSRGIPFTTLNVDREPESAKALAELTGGPLHVPVLRIGSTVQKGFEKTLWNNLLDMAGYPPNKAKADKSKPAEP